MEAQEELQKHTDQLTKLIKSNKQLEDERRNIERTIEKVKEQKQILVS